VQPEQRMILTVVSPAESKNILDGYI
jgi:hypothetical protein